jgi:hypothetical protein
MAFSGTPRGRTRQSDHAVSLQRAQQASATWTATSLVGEPACLLMLPYTDLQADGSTL